MTSNGRLAPAEREALLVQCWMAHDARWFAAAALAGGMELANRLNRMAAREVGKVEVRRIAGALGLPPVRSADDWIRTQEALIGLLGPDLLDYRVSKESESACRMSIERCFAHDQVTRAGVETVQRVRRQAERLVGGVQRLVVALDQCIHIRQSAEPHGHRARISGRAPQRDDLLRRGARRTRVPAQQPVDGQTIGCLRPEVDVPPPPGDLRRAQREALQRQALGATAPSQVGVGQLGKAGQFDRRLAAREGHGRPDRESGRPGV